jgi:type I restriction enzyme S subunit
VQWTGFDLASSRFVADDSLDDYGKERFLCEGDLLWNSTGTGTAGRVAIYETDESVTAVADSHVTVVRLASCSPRYLWCVIASPWVQARIAPSHPDSLVSGTTQQVELNTSTARALPIPLPPFEEQSRIVAKVDELMTLCDTLEGQQQVRRKIQNNLRQSALQAVASAASPHELQSTWARLAYSFVKLFHTPDDVADLRNLILDLAANGFASEPHTDDSDPLTLLSQASHQQKVEFSARELREINALPEPTQENGRLRIALGRIVKLVSGQHLSPEEYNLRHEGIPYITGPAEFGDRRPTPTKWTTERRAVARFGDVLITVKGSGVGKTAICDLEELAISRQLMAIRALANLDRRYLSICIDSAERRFQEQKFGIAIPGIGRDEVLSLLVFLPSIEEQDRIVCRVDELMRLCDSLEWQLRSGQKIAGRLVTSAISSITGIAIEKEEEPMKAPQTELIASLRLGAAPDIKAQAPLATILARHHSEMSAKDLWLRFGGEIDAFYAQLKIEVTHGWILEPTMAEVREKQADAVSS